MRGDLYRHHLGPPGEQEGASTVALTRMTLEEVGGACRSRTPEEEAEFRRRMDATTEEDIRRHMIEDGEDPDEEPRFERVVLPQDVRKKLGMTQTEFANVARHPGRDPAQLGAEPLRAWSRRRRPCSS